MGFKIADAWFKSHKPSFTGVAHKKLRRLGPLGADEAPKPPKTLRGPPLETLVWYILVLDCGVAG